jgi:hypothetical protein
VRFLSLQLTLLLRCVCPYSWPCCCGFCLYC